MVRYRFRHRTHALLLLSEGLFFTQVQPKGFLLTRVDFVFAPSAAVLIQIIFCRLFFLFLFSLARVLRSI